MGVLIDLSYNGHKSSSATNYLENRFGNNPPEKISGDVIDAFCNAYAEVENYAPDKQRYENASDKELQNWYQGKQMYNENQGGWQDDLFDRFFDTDQNGKYTVKSDSGFITDDSTPLSDFQRKQMIAGLMSGNYDYDPMQNVSKGFFDSFSAAMPVDPLVIDLDGDGIETSTLQNGYMMDYKNDGFSELTAWVGKDDGILVHDKNNNGVIDNGSELLGDNYTKTDGTLASSGFDFLKYDKFCQLCA